MNIYVAHKRGGCELSFGRAVHADDDGVVALVGLEGDLLQGLHLLGAHLLDLAGEHGLGLSGRVDAVSLRKK